jgi:arginine N-succinyltransferase
MMIFRSAHTRDLEAIHLLAAQSGVVGITTLPKDIELLEKRLAWSTDSFNKSVITPKNEYYLFVLEDSASGKIVGTSAIEGAIGHDSPFYSYKLSKHTRFCHELSIRNDYQVLSLVNDYQGQSEICTLFLDPAYRCNSNGVLLSRARFLFIAHYPTRFTPTIIAEMRGVSDDKGNSPFWDDVGSHFFHMSFAQADRLTLSTNKQFITDLMPRQPIYVELLTPAAQAVMGKPHKNSMPAMNILLREGFRYNNYIDIFDAGPTIEARRDQIQTAASSKLVTVAEHSNDAIAGKRFIVANTKLDYRATASYLAFNQHQGSCCLSHETAELLQVKPGDCVRISPLGGSHE